MNNHESSRAVAAAILCRWIETDDFPDRMLADVKRDRAFVTELVYGSVRRKLTLEYILQKYVHRRPDPPALAALFAGVYQLCFMDDVEEYAAIHETVEAVKSRRRPDAVRVAGMVNAVLRNVQRERDALLRNLERQPDDIRLSHPPVLLRRWARQYGERDARLLCEWNNCPPETVLRVETSRVEVPCFLQALREKGIEVQPHPYASSDPFFVLARGVGVSSIPGYADGWFTVQDPATSIAVELLDPRPGEEVLDACAAPGGKTAMIASRMEGKGHLIAMDVHDDRLALLDDTVTRMHLRNTVVVRGDAARGFPQRDQQFDAILLDVPCTNTGVLRRRADARWRFSAQRQQRLIKEQERILSAMSAHVRPGGRLVYSTCSLETGENEELVNRWVREHPAFRFVKAKRLFPPKNGTDGAYAARLERKR